MLTLLPSPSPAHGPQAFYPLSPPHPPPSPSSHPSLLPVVAAAIMCGGKGPDEKTVVKLELELPQDSSFAYQPGDSIGIFPPNSDDDVQLVLQRCCSPLPSRFQPPPAPASTPRPIIDSETFLKWGVDLRACVTKKVFALRTRTLWVTVACVCLVLDLDNAAAAAAAAAAATSSALCRCLCDSVRCSQMLRELCCWCSDSDDSSRLLQVS